MAQPVTKGGILFVALSALQKCIRRGLEWEAMELAVLFVRTACEQARRWFEAGKIGEARPPGRPGAR
jgi:hypothetical protein